jgi:cell division transport system permease protein
LGILLFFLRELFSNLRRNPLVAASTITTVTVLTLLLGLFVTMLDNIELMAHDMAAGVQVVAYLDDNAAIATLEESIKGLPHVESVTLVHKEAALKRLMERMNGRIDLSDLRKNPLPNSLELKVDSPVNLRAVADKVRDYKGVYKVKFGESVAGQLIRFNTTLRTAGTFMLGLLFVSTILVVSNTIRLTVFARRKEIEVMQMVGASRWFIQVPFILEGVIQGLIGAALGAMAVAESYNLVVPQLSKAVPFIPLIQPGALLPHLVPWMLALGLLVGGLGSLISVNRYLKV